MRKWKLRETFEPVTEENEYKVIEAYSHKPRWRSISCSEITESLDLLNPEWPVIYRKKEKKDPTHEEIMTKWWRCKNGRWLKVSSYMQNDQEGSYILANHKRDKSYFLTLKSDDIPPESNL